MRRIETTGELSISRFSGDGHTMRVTVRNPGTVVEIEVSAEDFLLALTGRGGLRCKLTVNVDRLQAAAERAER